MRDLSFTESEAILRRGRIGRLAVRDAAGAYIVPIAYAYADGAIYAHMAPGRKLWLMRRWPHVAFQVDEITAPDHWQSVLVRGRYEELHDPDLQARARLALLRAFGGNLAAVTAGHGHRTSLAEAVLFRVVPEEVSGRAEDGAFQDAGAV